MSKLKRILVSLALIAASLGAVQAATAPFDVTATPLSASDAKFLERLESSGALDAAVDRSLRRIATQRQEQVKHEQEAEEARVSAMSKLARPVSAKSDFIYGAPGAAYSVIVYSDFECPYCKQFYGTPERSVDTLNGQANVVWRNFPLSFHNPAATVEAGAAVCAAAQGGITVFWKYAEGLMANTQRNGQGLPAVQGEPGIFALAKSLKLDMPTFKTCLTADSTQKRITDDIADGVKGGIRGTPGLLIRNNKTGETIAMKGATSADNLTAEIKRFISSNK